MFIIVLTIVVGILQSILSIFFIVRKKRKYANASEIITSFVLLCALKMLLFETKNVVLFAISLLEYCSVKIFLVLFFICLKTYMFYTIKNITSTDNPNDKKLKKAQKLYKVRYWPNLKLGLPGMANKTYTKTKIKFDAKGFPKFKSYFTIKLRKKHYHESRRRHAYRANKIVYQEVHSGKVKKRFSETEMYLFSKGITPAGYTWHHHQDAGILQLVNYEIHEQTPHVGGYSIWAE